MSNYKWPEMPLYKFGTNGDSSLDHAWHVAINQFASTESGTDEWPRWMYEAKDAAQEVPRLALLFKNERENKLATKMQSCSHCEPIPVKENHLTCCLGTKCSECQFLKAVEKTENATPEQIDWIKSWTCVGHILSGGGDRANEGFILTVDDRMFWDRLHHSLMSGPPEPEESPRNDAGEVKGE